ncbi:hypothetical protein C8F04DRAFT_1338152 [Mycena alexandri]|uniref:Uncharacterized protein n=1 Tax=Mycena alexandri TaxID=1745969 RepID=A0AAD6SZ68_9AGAR|nr:hypothetical protein C8F04DRAFT_1338152 [Mycena alexandri]
MNMERDGHPPNSTNGNAIERLLNTENKAILSLLHNVSARTTSVGGLSCGWGAGGANAERSRPLVKRRPMLFVVGVAKCTARCGKYQQCEDGYPPRRSTNRDPTGAHGGDAHQIKANECMSFEKNREILCSRTQKQIPLAAKLCHHACNVKAGLEFSYHCTTRKMTYNVLPAIQTTERGFGVLLELTAASVLEAFELPLYPGY